MKTYNLLICRQYVINIVTLISLVVVNSVFVLILAEFQSHNEQMLIQRIVNSKGNYYKGKCERLSTMDDT